MVFRDKPESYRRVQILVGSTGFAWQVTEVWEWVVKRRIFDPFLRSFWMDFVPS